ncbi:ATP-binding protein [Yeosuana marina]|uniref:ATP-binding protein n=1 Tax=Yeosuana marina TaxID=1565536 RepID=UPI0030C86CBF
MKIVLISFLFFIVKTNFCYTNNRNYQKNDSLSYYYQVANNPKGSSNLSDAFRFFNLKKKESLKSKDTLSIIYFLRQIAIIQYKLGDYHGSEVSVVEALKYLSNDKESPNNIENKVGLYNQLGRIYMELSDYETAIKYFNTALSFTNNESDINIINNNKALIYISQNKYEFAEKEFLKVYRNSVNKNDVKQTSRAIDNLGFIESKLNRPKALEDMLFALELRKTNNDYEGMYASYKHLMEYYKDRNNFKSSKYYGQKLYDIAKSINSASFIQDALSRLVDIGDSTHFLEYKKITDSIFKARQVQENKYAKIKYDYTEKEHKLQIAELEKEKQKNLKLFYLSLGGLITLAFIFTMIFLKSKHKKDKIQEVYITETRISKKVHDEVANDVYQVMSKLQGYSNSKEEVLDDLENLYARARDISKENGALDVNEHYEILLNDLLLSYKNDHVNIITRGISKIPWNSIESLKKITLYRVLQELMVNMKKHSHASNVALTFIQINNKITISYKDDGVGCKIKKSSGIQNMENRIKSINGNIIFESEIEKGFKTTITV